jgi:hypothetical protein
MPADFLVADYGKLSLSLSGAYAAKLLAGAQLQVNLNGRDAASVQLSNPSGGVFRHNDIVVPLSAMQPGHNILEITAKLPQVMDQSCDNGVSLGDAPKRLLLLGDSEIRFPRIARIGQLPNLTQTIAGGYPYSIPGSRPKLYVPSPDRGSLSAAITLAVRLAVAAGHPIAFTLVAANPGHGTGHGLVVAPARALDPALMTDIGLDPGAVQRGWQQRVNPDGGQVADVAMAGGSAAGGRSSRHYPVTAAVLSRQQTAGSAVETSAAEAEARAAPSGAWSDMLARRSVIDKSVDLVRSAKAQVANAMDFAIAVARTQFGWNLASSFDLQLGPAASLIVAQGYRAADDDDVFTIVTAPTPTTLARSVEAIVNPAQWAGLHGRLSVVSEVGQILDSAEPARVRLIQTAPTSFRNARLIVAGWLSLHPAVYAIAALLLAALLAFSAHGLVKNAGRKNA